MDEKVILKINTIDHIVELKPSLDIDALIKIDTSKKTITGLKNIFEKLIIHSFVENTKIKVEIDNENRLVKEVNDDVAKLINDMVDDFNERISNAHEEI